MTYVKIVDGVVVQKQPYAQEGFIEADASIVCGMLYDGETYSPPEPPPDPIPTRVPMNRARKAMILDGISIDSVDAAIAAIPDEQARALAVADWEYSGHVVYGSPLVLSLATVLGLTQSRVDQLFITANSLES